MTMLITQLYQQMLEEDRPTATSLRAIAMLGYDTIEEFASAARVVPTAFETYLHTDIEKLLDKLRPEPIPAADLERIRGIDYGLGVELSSIPSITAAPQVFFSEKGVRNEVDLTAEMPAIRDQNPRGACVAHAALAVFEHRLGQQDMPPDMSEQFLTFICKEDDGMPHLEGSSLGTAFARLQRLGCCREETWRYNNRSIPCNWGQGPPPAGASNEASEFRIDGIDQIAPRRVLDLKVVLDSNRCVAFSIPAFRSWFCSDEVKASGNIHMPPPGDLPMGGHAMCMVGYRDMPDKPLLGGGVFLIRNSWGERWGNKGYGTIPYRFIECFAAEAFSIDALLAR